MSVRANGRKGKGVVQRPERWSLRRPGSGLVVAPDGRWLAAALAGGTARLWEAGAGQESRALVLGARAVRALAFSPDGRLLAAGDAEGRARLWSIPEGEPQVEWQEAGDAFYRMAFSPQGRWLAAGLRSGTLWLGEVRP